MPSEYLISVSRRHDCDQGKKKADLVAPKTRTKEKLKRREVKIEIHRHWWLWDE